MVMGEMRSFAAALTRILLAAALFGLSACEEPNVPTSTYYQERIEPIVQVGCAQQTNGCHVASPAGEATGNLDIGSYDALLRRPDVLHPYGPYPVGVFLLKGGDDVDIAVETWDPSPGTSERLVNIETDIRHNAGALIRRGSDGYAELKRWLEAGAQRNGVPDETLAVNEGACVPGVGHFEGFDPEVAPADEASYRRFRDEVMPVLRQSCAGSSCHGSSIADLYLSCGENEAELRSNYFTTLSHVTSPVSTSGLLRRPLSTLRGGTYHEGGNVFASTEDPAYQTLFNWAEDIATRAPEILRDEDPDPGLRFFANRVQPVLVRKGCMFLNCHSPAMFHDLRLRGGDGGVFSRIATRRNYEMSRSMLGLESPSVNDGRLVAKNLFPAGSHDGAEGILHRGGSLFEDFSGNGEINLADPTDCDGFDVDNGDLNEIPAYCVLERWHEIEREAAIASGEVQDNATAVYWVQRSGDAGSTFDFDTFRGGADLRRADLSFAADGAATLGAGESLLGNCGLGASPDVRSPAVSWDASRIAFAARPDAGSPLRLYEVAPDGSTCSPIDTQSPGAMAEGILLHDFDPAYAPDGRLVFASTRGNVDGESAHRGPSRTPAALAPNANLYVLEEGAVRQLTFLLNQELSPSFMLDGRLILTAEKRAQDFHQYALRRQNLDGGDYHPLYAQRDSMGFGAATEVIELTNRNLLFVAAPLTPEAQGGRDGAGTLVLVNRSLGPDQSNRDTGDRAYLHSMRIPHPGAAGGVPGVPGGNAARGVFRSPSPLPDGRVLVSCDPDATDLQAAHRWRLCVLDPDTGALQTIDPDAGAQHLEPVARYARMHTELFVSRVDEANGSTFIDADLAPSAQVTYVDFPMLATLLFDNTRNGRPIDTRIGGFRVHEVVPPPASATQFAGLDNVATDAFGPFHAAQRDLGFVPLFGDGSARIRIPGGVPIVLQPTDADGNALNFLEGAPFTGEMRQREAVQLYPGEVLKQSFPRRFFNGFCGNCHGSISGRELDIAVMPDILTGASQATAADALPLDLR